MREKSRMEKSLHQAEAEISRLRAEIRSDTVRDLSAADADNATLKVIYLCVTVMRFILVLCDCVNQLSNIIKLVEKAYSLTLTTLCREFMENTCAPRVSAKP